MSIVIQNTPQNAQKKKKNITLQPNKNGVGFCGAKHRKNHNVLWKVPSENILLDNSKNNKEEQSKKKYLLLANYFLLFWIKKIFQNEKKKFVMQNTKIYIKKSNREVLGSYNSQEDICFVFWSKWVQRKKIKHEGMSGRKMCYKTRKFTILLKIL